MRGDPRASPSPGPFAVDERELAEYVSRVLGRAVKPRSPRIESLGDPVVSSTAGLWRLRSAPGDESWSLIVKLVQHSRRGDAQWATSQDPVDPMYWRREPLAYSSGLLGSLAGGLRAPRCVASRPIGDDREALWLEDVRGVPAADWPLERFRVAARHFGELQGGFVTNRALPRERWLSRGWLRAYLDRRAGEVDRQIVTAEWRNAPIDPDLRGWNERLWRERSRRLAWLDQLPRTLCHLDAWVPNLFADDRRPGAEVTVAIDWAYVGIGALGEDMGNVVPDSALGSFVDPKGAHALFEALHAGYLDGLHDAGWRGDPRLPRLGMATAAAVKFAWVLPGLVGADDDEDLRARRIAVASVLRELDREASQLAGELGLLVS